jgi:exopolyphosphatase/pppGpp-phosphohydrolase
VRVAIIDIGANTLRLLVAGQSGQQVVPVHVERKALRLGEEIERHG